MYIYNINEVCWCIYIIYTLVYNFKLYTLHVSCATCGTCTTFGSKFFIHGLFKFRSTHHTVLGHVKRRHQIVQQWCTGVCSMVFKKRGGNFFFINHTVPVQIQVIKITQSLPHVFGIIGNNQIQRGHKGIFFIKPVPIVTLTFQFVAQIHQWLYVAKTTQQIAWQRNIVHLIYINVDTIANILFLLYLYGKPARRLARLGHEQAQTPFWWGKAIRFAIGHTTLYWWGMFFLL